MTNNFHSGLIPPSNTNTKVCWCNLKKEKKYELKLPKVTHAQLPNEFMRFLVLTLCPRAHADVWATVCHSNFHCIQFLICYIQTWFVLHFVGDHCFCTKKNKKTTFGTSYFVKMMVSPKVKCNSSFHLLKKIVIINRIMSILPWFIELTGLLGSFCNAHF